MCRRSRTVASMLYEFHEDISTGCEKMGSTTAANGDAKPRAIVCLRIRIAGTAPERDPLPLPSRSLPIVLYCINHCSVETYVGYIVVGDG